MRRMVGTPVAAAAPDLGRRGVDGRALADQLLGSMLHQVLFAGVFHADPHPGNVLVLDDGRLRLLDFGSVGRLDRTTRTALLEVLLAVERQDPAGLTDALLAVVARPGDLDAAASTASRPRWSRTASASTSACSPTPTTAASSPGWCATSCSPSSGRSPA
jgi:ubiquinone biosynthesis protein